MPHKSFHQLKYELSQISEDVIEASLKLREPSLEAIRGLQDRLIAFEKAIPFPLRCRTAYLSLPSLYPNQQDAIIDTPEINKRDLRVTLQVGFHTVERGATGVDSSNSHWQ
jgi:hypothetical protein